LGFNPIFIHEKDGSNLKGLIERKDFDLVLMDQNLRFKVCGDDVVRTLRSNGIFTNIILYSQYRDYEDKLQKNLDGVYFTDREHLEEKAGKIIVETLRRDLDISNIRGAFIAETIYAASQMEEAITKLLKLKDPEYSFLIEQMQDEHFNDFLKYKIIKRFLSEEIKSMNIKIAAGGAKPDPALVARKKKLEEIEPIFTEFQKEIIEFRNVLAHAKPCPNKKNTLMVKNPNSHRLREQVFDANYCQEVRLLFKKHSKALEDLAALL
jgi:CheY-like chemotaxis protein